jgi:hypothetical protein
VKLQFHIPSYYLQSTINTAVSIDGLFKPIIIPSTPTHKFISGKPRFDRIRHYALTDSIYTGDSAIFGWRIGKPARAEGHVMKNVFMILFGMDPEDVEAE